MSEFPDVDLSVVSDEDDVGPGMVEHEYIHLDEVDITKSYDMSVHVFIYEHEGDRDGELLDTVGVLRENYVMASGVVWPDWVEDAMPLDTDVLDALEWIISMGFRPNEDDLESIRETLT